MAISTAGNQTNQIIKGNPISMPPAQQSYNLG